MSKVFVIDANRKPLNPVHPGCARWLLTHQKAAVLRRFPFTIILKQPIEAPTQPLRIKLDPGSQTTGIAIVNDTSGEVIFAAELTHRGPAIRQALEKRRAVRRNRRQRQTRYRKPRFASRRRKDGWLPPSLESRVCQVITWVKRLMRLYPLAAITQELVRFDMQAIEDPDIQGMQYQQGTLAGYEVREYLLEKWNRQCAYCGVKKLPLQVEHIQARANGGTDRLSNLCLACEACNQAKGKQDVRLFLSDNPAVLQHLLAQTKAPLKDAAVNSTRWVLFQRLNALRLPVEVGTGGRTKFNRVSRHLPKNHWLDAACVGASTPETLYTQGVGPLLIVARGHGNRQRCAMSRFGFPRSRPKGAKQIKGFQTGDLVRVVVPAGKNQGTHEGRVLVRASGSFDLQTAQGRVQGVSHRFCTPLHRCDGYSYLKGAGHCSLV